MAIIFCNGGKKGGIVGELVGENGEKGCQSGQARAVKSSEPPRTMQKGSAPVIS